ncbi:Hypothetical protein NTJ_07942 [Nesidiocoris tenuis]|uniref:Uncharacterized protein n=1 Tax=Nesidiocoris tenuis TaxID=355587 RepID=A0ABN7ASV0_9HEMI|nr:Hypothetical protein NTJ_07942 [Nesidiocoris tenuis]
MEQVERRISFLEQKTFKVRKLNREDSSILFLLARIFILRSVVYIHPIKEPVNESFGHFIDPSFSLLCRRFFNHPTNQKCGFGRWTCGPSA